MAPNTTRVLLQSNPSHTDRRKCYGIKLDSTIPIKSSSYKASLVFHMHPLQSTLDHFLRRAVMPSSDNNMPSEACVGEVCEFTV